MNYMRLEELEKTVQLKKCCCGCSLETGSKIVGYTQAIVYQFPFAAALFVLCATLMQKDLVVLKEDLMIFSYGSLHGILAIYLLVGVYKKKPQYLKVWILFNLAHVILTILGIVIWTILIIMGFHPYAIVVALGLAHIGGMLYSVVVVHSYFLELTQGLIQEPHDHSTQDINSVQLLK